MLCGVGVGSSAAIYGNDAGRCAATSDSATQSSAPFAGTAWSVGEGRSLSLVRCHPIPRSSLANPAREAAGVVGVGSRYPIQDQSDAILNTATGIPGSGRRTRCRTFPTVPVRAPDSLSFNTQRSMRG